MPQPTYQQEWEPGVKYVCNARIYGDIHSVIVDKGQRPIVIEIDGNEITFMVQRKEVFLG